MDPASPTSITIKDVARLAGASVATVSAVINRKGTASEATKRRVEEAMRALDYHPDNLARSLKTGKSKVIGMLVPDVSNPFFIEVMCGVEETARKHGYSVILSNSNESPEQEQAGLDIFYSQRVDGVVLACASGETAYDRRTLRRFPIVLIDRLPSASYAGGAVIIDNAEAAYTATKYLIGLGHKRIAIIAGRTDLSLGRDRLAGFRRAMSEADLTVRESDCREGDFHPESGYRSGVELLKPAKRATAIFSCGNGMTLGLMRALNELEVSCPRDVSVLTFDDFPWANYFHPQMTAIAQPAHEMGQQAMQRLLTILQPDPAQKRAAAGPLTVLKAELRIRESTAAYRPRS
jgi:LacI family transcriptional regulator